MIGFYAHTVKSDLKVDKVRLAILSAMTAYARTVEKEFRKIVSTWEEEVEFVTVKAFPRSGTIEVMVYTDNQTYKWVDSGTSPHEIWAGWYTGLSDKKLLSFYTPSVPKTKPGKLESGISSAGETHIMTPYVQHPGIKPRGFDKKIARMMKPVFREMMATAIHDAIYDAMHGN